MYDDATRPLIVGLPDVPWLDPAEGAPRRAYPSRTGRGGRLLLALAATALALAGTVLVTRAIDAAPAQPLARTEAPGLSLLEASAAPDIAARPAPASRS